MRWLLFSRLCTWNVISDEELAPVFADPEADFGDSDCDQLIADAKNLMRACLQGDAAKRPTVLQILAHRFFDPKAPAPPPMGMRYHGFLSHAQADASGTVAGLYHLYKLLGRCPPRNHFAAMLCPTPPCRSL